MSGNAITVTGSSRTFATVMAVRLGDGAVMRVQKVTPTGLVLHSPWWWRAWRWVKRRLR